MRLRLRRHMTPVDTGPRLVWVEDLTHPNGIATIKRHYSDGTVDWAYLDYGNPTGISVDSPFDHDPRPTPRGYIP